MTLTINLTPKQASALAKRVSQTESAEVVAANIVTEQCQAWADSDYLATTNTLAERLKDKSQDVLDSVISQLESIP